MADVIINQLRKTYSDGSEILKGISLDVADGEFIILVGPSGCGKSTLLRMIAGLESITEGDLYIGARRANDIDPSKRGVAMVFQSYALYPHLTVRENMGFSLWFNKTPKAQILQDVEGVANVLQIAHILDKKPGDLSGGQRQRVAIGRAIVRSPDVFLFDEPLSNLDAALRTDMRTELTRLHRRLKSTMIYVTHDQVEAMTMGDRICVLNKGEVQQVDSPMNLYHDPKNKFVASFIGSPSMNFAQGIIRKANDALYVEFSGYSLPLPQRLYATAQRYLNHDIWCGIRPEHIGNRRLLAEGMPEFMVDVDVHERLGFDEIIHFRLGEHHYLSRIPHEKSELAAGQPQCKVVFDRDKLHLFDMVTEKNITIS
jgi:multiple sugar transport system ATP-binding protein